MRYRANETLALSARRTYYWRPRRRGLTRNNPHSRSLRNAKVPAMAKVAAPAASAAPASFAVAPAAPDSLAAVKARAQVLGARRKRPNPESKDYIQIAEYERFEKGMFNTRANAVTRSIEIAGVVLIWDELD